MNAQRPPAVEEVSAATAQLNSLLLQRVKLSNDIARMRKLVTCLGQKAGSSSIGRAIIQGKLFDQNFKFT